MDNDSGFSSKVFCMLIINHLKSGPSGHAIHGKRLVKGKLLPALAVVLLLSGCSNLSFLPDDDILAIKPNTREQVFLFYNRTVSVLKEQPITDKTHFVLTVGQNPRDAFRYLPVFDSGINKLSDYRCRVIRRSKEVESISKSDLYKGSTSGASQISETSFLLPVFENGIEPGDLIEVIYQHEVQLPQLGFYIDFSSCPENSQNLTFQINSTPEIDPLVITRNADFTVTDEHQDGIRTTKYHLDRMSKPKGDPFFSKINPSPAILVSPFFKKDDWKSFGDWYLNLIASKNPRKDELKGLAESLTTGLSDTLSRLNALFNYCQREIRYEQVYLRQGEFIPNSVSDILKRKYGDCKDYSFLFYQLAQAIDIPVKLALVYRGRGFEHSNEIPVSQFNHMIAMYEDSTGVYWYDGTNRISIPGLPGDDLIGQTTLVLQNGGSRLQSIHESGKNILTIHATIHPGSTGAEGNYSVIFGGEFTILPAYWSLFLNTGDLNQYFARWIKEHIHSEMMVSDLKWYTDKNTFTLEFKGKTPNAIRTLSNERVTTLSRLFNRLLPSDTDGSTRNNFFFYPSYNRVEVEISGLSESPIKTGLLEIDPGPWISNNQKEQATKKLQEINSIFSSLHYLKDNK